MTGPPEPLSASGDHVAARLAKPGVHGDEEIVCVHPGGPRLVGYDAVRASWERIFAGEGRIAFRLTDLVVMASSDGRRVAAEYKVHGEYLVADDGLPAAHGQRYLLPGGAFFEVADGRIRRVTNYYNLQDWLAQVSRQGT